MSTDRELLELAAKAAGMPLTDNGVRDLDRWEYIFGGDSSWGLFKNNANGTQRRWTPLVDDGDALRLAVRLRFRIEHRIRSGGTWYVRVTWDCGIAEEQHDEDHGSDAEAATRRAIVRAAAELGKEMTDRAELPPLLKRLVESIDVVDGVACWDYSLMYELRDHMHDAEAALATQAAEIERLRADLRLQEAAAKAYQWAYEYLQDRMHSIDRHGWAEDCDEEITSRIARLQQDAARAPKGAG